jgi:hypothetical protein
MAPAVPSTLGLQHAIEKIVKVHGHSRNDTSTAMLVNSQGSSPTRGQHERTNKLMEISSSTRYRVAASRLFAAILRAEKWNMEPTISKFGV